LMRSGHIAPRLTRSSSSNPRHVPGVLFAPRPEHPFCFVPTHLPRQPVSRPGSRHIRVAAFCTRLTNGVLRVVGMDGVSPSAYASGCIRLGGDITRFFCPVGRAAQSGQLSPLSDFTPPATSPSDPPS
jgi:hypothetical protein